MPWEKTTVCEGENGGEVKQPATAKRGRQVRQVTFGVQVWEKHEGQSFLPSLKLSMTLHTNTKSWVNGFTSPGTQSSFVLDKVTVATEVAQFDQTAESYGMDRTCLIQMGNDTAF